MSSEINCCCSVAYKRTKGFPQPKQTYKRIPNVLLRPATPILRVLGSTLLALGSTVRVLGSTMLALGSTVRVLGSTVLALGSTQCAYLPGLPRLIALFV